MPVDRLTSGAGPPWRCFQRERPDPRHHGYVQPGSSSAAEPGREHLADLETCLLLQGEVTVPPDGGEPVRFGAGDLVVFNAGLRCA